MVYLSKQKSLFVHVFVNVLANIYYKFTNQCTMYMYAIYSIKLIGIDTFVKQIKIQLDLLKRSNQIRQKFLLCIFKCHWLQIL